MLSLILSIVYNCRTANTWSNDLALAVTHFTDNRLSFGILFGCTDKIELQVVNRLAKSQEQSFHPILLVGILAELERERMAEVVESSIDRIEEAIFDMDTGTSSGRKSSESSEDGSYPGGSRAARRTVWLNTTFLRNRLEVWKTQMSKMMEHVDEISAKIISVTDEDAPFGDSVYPDEDKRLLRIGDLIKDRLRALIEEFEEKMEECTMRVDGMAMATQWVLTKLLDFNILLL
ncbi:hypothetical protein SLS53_004368 [Cytospora paraplurivora]|uniref:Uncharacterized protein n=1 Tax=Cytospora paraplurivora TaxID=2898453 RepID=A0AAN9YFY5_9PEZI